MYDLHCHMLPGIDDGAQTLDTAIKMAIMAADDGITHIACSPHIYPGLYENTAEIIEETRQSFSETLREEGIPLEIGIAADVHLVPEVMDGLKTGRIPTINGSRYFLLEPSHHVAPPHFTESVFNFITAGYIPVITHPERLGWVGDHYDEFKEVVNNGAWIQLTSGSVSGRFGGGPKYWSEKMLSDGIVHILATDAHNLGNRSPLLAEGRDAAAKWVGEEEADNMVNIRTKGIWEDVDPTELPSALIFRSSERKLHKRSFLSKLFGN